MRKFVAHRVNQQHLADLNLLEYRQLDCSKITALRPHALLLERADTDPLWGLFPELSVVSLARLGFDEPIWSASIEATGFPALLCERTRNELEHVVRRGRSSLCDLHCCAPVDSVLLLHCSIKRPVGNPTRYEETYQTSNPA